MVRLRGAAARSARRYSDPVTSTAPSTPASSRARRERFRRGLHRLRSREPSTRQALQVPRRTSARAFDDSVATRVSPHGRERREHPVGVLVPEDRRDDDVAAVGQSRQEPADAVEGVRAVPDLERRLRDALEAAGEATVPRPRPDRPCPRETSPRRRGRARGSSAPSGRSGDERASCHSGSQRTTVAPSRTTASFSPAISSRVSPSTSVCSSPTFVSTTTGAREHVRRVEPPAEACLDHRSVDALANSASAAAVSTSNCVAPSALGRRRERARPRARSPSGSVSSRSCQPDTCGLVYAPTRRPFARRSAAIIRVVVDLPFVPTTWIDGYVSWGSPSSASSARIRSSPNSSGHGESPATQSVAGDRVELAAVPLELLPLGLDDVGGRVGGEAVVGEHLLGAGDLAAEPLALRLDVAVRASGAPASRPRRRCAARRRPRAGRARRCAGRSPPPPAPRRARPPRLRRRPRATARRSAACSRAGQVRPDLLGDVRHRRVQQLQQPLERGERGRLDIGLAEAAA